MDNLGVIACHRQAQSLAWTGYKLSESTVDPPSIVSNYLGRLKEQIMTTQETENQGPQGLRDAHERRGKALDVANARFMDIGLKAIGLDPDEGLGKAVAEGYDGDFTDEAIAAFAKEKYSHEPKAPTTTEPIAETTPAPEPTEQEIAGKETAEVMAGTQGAPPVENNKSENEVMDDNMPDLGKPMSDANRHAYYDAVESVIAP